MSSSSKQRSIRSAAVVLPCTDLDQTLAFFVEKLGFRTDAVFPADAPCVAVIVGNGLRIRLEVSESAGSAGRLRIECDDPDLITDAPLIAPNGTRIDLVESEPALSLPPLVPRLEVSRPDDDATWSTGRAGMKYRDLMPSRQGGRYIASHIRIPDGGEVPDYVHYHHVRFQIIYCYRGWVRVVYEDQGPPFLMKAGDCVVQPPRIRHRVLESSPGLEVIEVGCPAEHETRADLALELPNDVNRSDRKFEGQRFIRHVAADASWTPWRLVGFECRDTGIADATSGVGGVSIVRPIDGSAQGESTHDGELLFFFVLSGSVTFACDGSGEERLRTASSIAIPPGRPYGIADVSRDLELLEVTVPTTARN